MVLLLLLFLPCFWWCRVHHKHFYFPKLEWIGKEFALLSYEIWLRVLIFSLLVLALAKPFVYESKENSHKKGRDLVLAIDASGSMAQSGFDAKTRFKTKYETTLSLAKTFTQKRFNDNIGAVIFGTFAYTASPLTYDLEALRNMLDMATVGIAGESTAIGDAIMQSLRTLSYGEAKNRVVILLTDGFHNAGSTSPKAAVAEAKKRGVRIYTIGIGKRRDYDFALLETIAKETGATSYAAESAETMKEVFAQISALEPSPIRSENYLHKRLLASLPLLIALGLLSLWISKDMKERT